MNTILEKQEEGFRRHYKEVTPGETVEKLKKILSDLGVEVEEQWNKDSRIGTSSLRLSIKGTSIGTNGKGVSPEYATASAYAEFLERLQNNRISMCNINFDGEKSYYTSADEKWMSVFEIVEQGNLVLQNFFNTFGVGDSYLKKIAIFQKMNHTEFDVMKRKNEYLTTPFYNVTKGVVEYLPFFIYSRIYGSNGMSAGNTPGEAVVQGLSEIIERVVQKKLFLEKPCLPDVPDDVIAKYPYIEEMYKKLQQLDGYTVMLKDCSFGGKYPVAGLIIIENNTGSYGVKLGCHPEYGIAMERAFTETAQGVDVTEYCHNSILDFNNAGIDSEINITNSYRCGIGQFPFELFGDTPTYEYTPVPDVKGKSNEEIMKEWIADIEAEGYQVLIRDVSYLGFPSYHVIIPGLSEMRDFKQLEYKIYNIKGMVANLLRKPSLINRDNVKYVRACLEYSAGSQMENAMGAHYLLPMNCNLPGEEIGFGHVYFAVMCDIMLGEYQTASKRMKGMLRYWKEVSGVSVRKDPEMLKKYKAVYHYTTAMNQLQDHEKAISYLKKFFDKEIVDWLDVTFKNPEEVFVKQYPTIDIMDDKENSFGKCEYKTLKEVLEKIFAAQEKSGLKQDDLGCIFG